MRFRAHVCTAWASPLHCELPSPSPVGPGHSIKPGLDPLGVTTSWVVLVRNLERTSPVHALHFGKKDAIQKKNPGCLVFGKAAQPSPIGALAWPSEEMPRQSQLV